MYARIIRPVLFLFPPEWTHRLAGWVLQMLFSIPLLKGLVSRYYTLEDKRLEREVAGLRFPNPVGVAAGFDKEARLYNALGGLGFGHVEIGAVTPLPQQGNPKPRLFRLPKDRALINRMGFNNPGLEAYVRRLKKRSPRVIIGVNIGKNTATPEEKAVEDYCQCFRALADLVDYFSLNVSCPNVGSIHIWQEKEALDRLLHAIIQLNRLRSKPKPLFLKISPDLTKQQLDELLELVKLHRIDGIIATNTTTSRYGVSASVAMSAGNGGLSGKPLRERATGVVAYLHAKSHGRIPIIGVGGIFHPTDAREKLQAGASLIQLYSGFIYEGPGIAKKINRSLLAQAEDRRHPFSNNGVRFRTQ